MLVVIKSAPFILIDGQGNTFKVSKSVYDEESKKGKVFREAPDTAFWAALANKKECPYRIASDLEIAGRKVKDKIKGKEREINLPDMTSDKNEEKADVKKK
ncbi:hypothetical protein H8E88_05115 [candidate division KSB1 bacterium]|nr:hypothetical protein [candidate division KSB1 bacterium]